MGMEVEDVDMGPEYICLDGGEDETTTDEECTGLTPGQILGSAAYRHLKSRPVSRILSACMHRFTIAQHDSCHNENIAKLVRMLAELKSPAEKPVEKRSHRQHQYDVPREDNHMKVCNPYPLLLILLEVSINGKQAAVREYVCYLFGYGQTPVPSQDEL
jgi:hypothetical protein